MGINIGKDLANLNRLVHHQINRHRQKNDSTDLDDERMSRAGMGVIFFLYENQNKDIFQKDIEKEFSVRKSTASSVLTTLEEKGYIKRESSKEDKRLKRIVLTDKASTITDEVKASHNFINEKLTRNIPENELQQFKETLAKMKRNLED